jgi:hypothetical protein
MKARTVGWIIAGLVALTLTIGGAGLALAQGPTGMMGGSGPASTGYRGMGSGGMMHGGPAGTGGMMGGNGMLGGSGMMGGYGGTGQPVTSLDQAQLAVQTYVRQYGNSDLVLDEVMEFQQNFYAIVKEQSTGISAFEVLVNKETGAVFPEYGPDMMWNTRYGMMRGGNDTTQPMTISADQATKLASDWLAQNQPGATTETPDAFYGYYTLHITKDGTVTGMLSVNGYSGQVWYHTWHGAFIGMKDAAS